MKKSIKQTVTNFEELRSFLKENLIHLCRPQHVFLLYGNLGTGKTHLVKQVLELLGGDEGSSPTFSIINQYKSSIADIYHLDLYRIKNSNELENIGFWDLFNSDSLIFIEWPDRVNEWQIPKGWKEVILRLEFGKNETERIIELMY